MTHSDIEHRPVSLRTETIPVQPQAEVRPAASSASIGEWLLRAIIPLAILIGGGFAYQFLSVEQEKEETPPAKPQELSTRVTEVHVQDYSVVIKTNGIVQPHNEVGISAQVSGQIVRVSTAFEAGSYFAKGELLVELDDRDYRTLLAVAEANHLVAESALELATESHERKLKLYSRKGISEAEIKSSLAAKAQAAAQVDSSASRVEQAERDLERTEIVAPFDGRVRVNSVGLGQLVGSGAPLGVIFAVDFAEVRLPIAGREIPFLTLPELATDAPVDVELRDGINSDRDVVWKGQIVRTEGALDPNSLELFAIARIDDPFGLSSGNPPLRIGQPVVAAIAGMVLEDVVALPRGSVRQLDKINLVHKTEHTLIPLTIDAIWKDEDFVIVRDPLIEDKSLLATTHIVYAPAGSKVEIIPDVTEADVTEVAEKTSTNGKTKSVTN